LIQSKHQGPEIVEDFRVLEQDAAFVGLILLAALLRTLLEEAP